MTKDGLRTILTGLLIGLLTCSPIWAQQTTFPLSPVASPNVSFAAPQVVQYNAVTLTASSTNCSTAGSCLVLSLGPADATANISLAGSSYSGVTVQFESQVGDGNWTNISCPTWSQGAAVSSATATGAWQCDVAGKNQIRLRMSAFTSGTVNAALSSSVARSTVGSIPVPQNLATTSTPNFANINFNGMPTLVFMTANVATASGSNTALTGLTWTVPANTAVNYPFHCELTYNQATGATANAFTITNSVAATNGTLWGFASTAATAVSRLVTKAYTGTTATTIVSVTPGATSTDELVTLEGFIEQPSGSASTVTIGITTTSGGTDVTTVARDSWCRLF